MPAVRIALAAILVIACGREPRPDTTRVDSSTKSVAAAPAASAPTSAKGECPATGKWAMCSVTERLVRAGLGPRQDSSAVSETPLGPRGTLLRLGTSDLEIYIYSDEQTRERDAAKLDRAQYLAYDAPQSMRPLPTLIQSANLIGIMHSRNDHLRERVADAITAGPPQPVRP